MTTAGDPRVVVVTGANRGLGLEVARQCAARGDTVVLGSRHLEAGAEVAARLGALPGRVLARQLDVGDAAGLRALASDLGTELGRVDVVVNNAGAYYDDHQRAATADLSVVRQALETNLLGAWQVSQSLLPLLRRSRHPRLVMVSSQIGSLTGMSGATPAYAVSKAALNALTRALAEDLRDDGVLVNAVSPGWTATDMGGLGGPGGRPLAEGAASVLWAVDLPDTGPTGTFTQDGRPLPW